MKYVLLMLCFIGCANAHDKHDDAMQPYIDKIEHQYNEDLSDITFEFINKFTQEKRIAECEVTQNKNIIRFAKIYWDKYDDLSKYLILIHEVGHCVFDRVHRNDVLPNGCPASIMNQFYNPAFNKCYLNNTQYYLDELKS